MTFNNPYALWGLILVPLIILMYILKQNFEEKKVASTFLWDLAINQDEVNTPWQKLKNNILMILQIIVALLLVAALAKPMIFQNRLTDQPEVLVIDNSGSMSAMYEDDTTRLARGKRLAKERIDKLAKGTPLTIITVGDRINVLLSDEVDKDKLKNGIDKIEQSYGSEEIKENIEFIKSVARNYEVETISIYTDHLVDDAIFDATIINNVGTNVSIDYVNAYSQENGSYEVMTKISNRYKEKTTVNLQLFDSKDKLVDLVEVELEGNESKNVLIDDIQLDGPFIYCEIKEKDLIEVDNKVYATLDSTETKKILLISQGNIFLEKAIVASGRYELYKTDSAEDIPKDYDMYIYDGIDPIQIPETGGLIFIDTRSIDGYISISDESKSGYAHFIETPVTKYVVDEEFAITAYNKINNQNDLESVAMVGDDAVMSLGNLKGRKYGVVSFDFHDSDFPLSMSFPVVVDRLLGFMLGEVSQISKQYFAEEEIAFEPLSTTKKLEIITPNGVTNELELTYPITYFSSTQDLGIYTVIQTDGEEKKKTDYIKVGFPSNSESKIEAVDDETNVIMNKNMENRKVSLDLSFIIILLIILISIYEWKKYVRG